MTALYFSKMFGVEKIDISPLFETEKGLENGHSIIGTLLKNKHFKITLLIEKNYSTDWLFRCRKIPWTNSSGIINRKFTKKNWKYTS